ncbi:fibronectin type III domain-containing protein 4, partial [Notothenia coriiceps]|uniref:Fibronectin type III domain-containing protein 4 n=1 Tax=Notothenia coriiceps TaxID=8208 RepID=A0A6I9PDS5_9TELE
RPPAPVNVSVMHLRADSATVSWEVPEGDIIIGFSISQQRQEGHVQRFIREVNTTSRSCVLWDLDEETDYIIQVQSIGLYGESQASKKVHFRTLKKTDHFPSNGSNQDDPTVQGLDKSRHLQTGEMIIIVVVLVMWAVPHPEILRGIAAGRSKVQIQTQRRQSLCCQSSWTFEQPP